MRAQGVRGPDQLWLPLLPPLLLIPQLPDQLLRPLGSALRPAPQLPQVVLAGTWLWSAEAMASRAVGIRPSHRALPAAPLALGLPCPVS